MPRLSSSILFLSACLLASWACRAETALGQPIVPPGAPKSEFVDDPAVGKDPFFPKSNRRKFVPKTQDEPAPDPIVPDFIVLKGISVNQGRKLAIINNHTVAEGEEFTLRYNGQVLKVQCVEIKEKSATIATGGATKEIPLRPTLH